MSNIGIDLSANDASPLWNLGTVITHETAAGTKKYKYIQYNAAAAAVAGVAGEVAYYATVAVGDATGTIVTSDLSDSDEMGAGVLQASLTDDYYGWIQVQGVATLTIALTAGSDGDQLTPTGATDGTLDVVVTTVALMDHCATALDVSAKVIMCHFKH